ncbi:unnamed protein product [Polarella glacialis]|uniref:FHA domain-containing protein n=1 Tax=Polarella glacialis TaxID=89957 RepID=A0A813GI75_POLGL|nr:unnamed protein product [Polarella glacialis]
MSVYGVLRSSDTVFLLEELATSVGRDETCDLRLESRGISKFHAQITFRPGGIDPTITDLGSSNGTFVNDEKITVRDAHLLSHGDLVRFSAYEKVSYRFELPGDASGIRHAPDHSSGQQRQHARSPPRAAVSDPSTAAPAAPFVPARPHAPGRRPDDLEGPDRGDLASAALPGVRRAVESLEGLYGQLLKARSSANALAGRPLPGGSGAQNPAEQSPGSSERALEKLLQRAEQLSALNIPEELRRLEEPDMLENAVPAERVLPKAKKQQKQEIQEMQEEDSGLAGDLEVKAAALRRRLVDFQDLAPHSAGGGSSGGEIGRETVPLLSHWREQVSSQDSLGRADSADVLRALLRAERASGELQRGEAACGRRWAALSQEGRQLSETGRSLRAAAQKVQSRRADVHAAAGAQRREAWGQLAAAATAAGSDQEQQAAVERVQQQLLELDAAVQAMQSEIGEREEQLSKLSAKRRQAEQRRELMEKLSVEGASDSGHPEASQASVDDIVDLELGVEELLWQLFQVEERRRRAEEQLPTNSHQPLADAPVPPFSASGSGMHNPDDASATFWQPSVPQTADDMHEAHFPATLPEESEDAEPPPALRPPPRPPLPPAVADLCERLAMPRDERRQLERERRGRGRSASPSRRPVCEQQQEQQEQQDRQEQEPQSTPQEQHEQKQDQRAQQQINEHEQQHQAQLAPHQPWPANAANTQGEVAGYPPANNGLWQPALPLPPTEPRLPGPGGSSALPSLPAPPSGQACPAAPGQPPFRRSVLDSQDFHEVGDSGTSQPWMGLGIGQFEAPVATQPRLPVPDGHRDTQPQLWDALPCAPVDGPLRSEGPGSFHPGALGVRGPSELTGPGFQGLPVLPPDVSPHAYAAAPGKQAHEGNNTAETQPYTVRAVSLQWDDE